MRSGMFERSIADSGRNAPGSLLEQVEVWAAEERGEEGRRLS
jgi:hypothetical protein